jgi:hypothetical protein
MVDFNRREMDCLIHDYGVVATSYEQHRGRVETYFRAVVEKCLVDGNIIKAEYITSRCPNKEIKDLCNEVISMEKLAIAIEKQREIGRIAAMEAELVAAREELARLKA